LENLGLAGIVSKRLTSIYKSGPSRTWIKVKNPKSPAATRVMERSAGVMDKCTTPAWRVMLI